MQGFYSVSCSQGSSTVRYARILSQNYGTLVRYAFKECVAVLYG